MHRVIFLGSAHSLFVIFNARPALGAREIGRSAPHCTRQKRKRQFPIVLQAGCSFPSLFSAGGGSPFLWRHTPLNLGERPPRFSLSNYSKYERRAREIMFHSEAPHPQYFRRVANSHFHRVVTSSKPGSVLPCLRSCNNVIDEKRAG